MQDIKGRGLTYNGRLITSVIEGADAKRAQICPGFVQINCQSESGMDNASGIQISTILWQAIQKRGAA